MLAWWSQQAGSVTLLRFGDPSFSTSCLKSSNLVVTPTYPPLSELSSTSFTTLSSSWLPILVASGELSATQQARQLGRRQPPNRQQRRGVGLLPVHGSQDPRRRARERLRQGELVTPKFTILVRCSLCLYAVFSRKVRELTALSLRPMFSSPRRTLLPRTEELKNIIRNARRVELVERTKARRCTGISMYSGGCLIGRRIHRHSFPRPRTCP